MSYCEEWDFKEISRITDVADLEFGNAAGHRADEGDIKRALMRAPGAAGVKTITVRNDSLVRDLSFLSALPSVTGVRLRGQRLATLAGLDSLQEGEFLDIDTAPNRSRNIRSIADATFHRLILRCASDSDMDAIAGTSIKELLLTSARQMSFSRWSSVPMSYLGLFSGTFEELSDTALMPELTSATLYGCRAFRRFRGDNHRIDWLVVQNCPSFEWASLGSLNSLGYLAVVGNRSGQVRLSELSGLAALVKLSISGPQVEGATAGVSVYLPSLRFLRANRLSARDVVECSQRSNGLLVSNDRVAYLDGSRVPMPSLE